MKLLPANHGTTPRQGLFVGLGELVWDEFPERRTPGGAPANFAFHVARLGGHAAVVSAVGRDLPGDDLKAWLRRSGLDTRCIQTTSLPTGSVAVELDVAGHPTFRIRPAAAWDTLTWNEELAELAMSSDCVCVGSVAQRSQTTHDLIGRFLSATRPSCLRIFDLNLREPYVDIKVIRRTLSLVNVLKLNDTEWTWLAPQLELNPDWSIGLKQLIDREDIKLIALTRGAQGSTLVNADGIHHLPGEQVDVLDTVGAGDAFTAALAIGFFRGDNISVIHRSSATLANFVCTQAGATPASQCALQAELRQLPSARAAQLQSLVTKRDLVLPSRDDFDVLGPEQDHLNCTVP